ncbi:hypothetical protein ENH_00035760 [Eimeria necatrix]|uniref:Uncharacterized protein n=1 Tax=Eimeria necatrix TaxID=51315 RepID=U6ML07_9EIME|nr:hypothetical protein ENH_00035760 [Eimeria necatrix]CDJ63129.1 hypothetical protein ENH_00035760 [Eimeria necatrix]
MQRQGAALDAVLAASCCVAVAAAPPLMSQHVTRASVIAAAVAADETKFIHRAPPRRLRTAQRTDDGLKPCSSSFKNQNVDITIITTSRGNSSGRSLPSSAAAAPPLRQLRSLQKPEREQSLESPVSADLQQQQQQQPPIAAQQYHPMEPAGLASPPLHS